MTMGPTMVCLKRSFKYFICLAYCDEFEVFDSFRDDPVVSEPSTDLPPPLRAVEEESTHDLRLPFRHKSGRKSSLPLIKPQIPSKRRSSLPLTRPLRLSERRSSIPLSKPLRVSSRRTSLPITVNLLRRRPSEPGSLIRTPSRISEESRYQAIPSPSSFYSIPPSR